MAKEYKVGERYYLPVIVKSICPGYKYPIELGFIDSNLCDTDDTTSIADEPDVLLTSDEIATTINTERAEVMETLGKQNLELSKQNEELSARVEELVRTSRVSEKRIDDYMEERRRYIMNIRLLLDKIAELEGKNG